MGIIARSHVDITSGGRGHQAATTSRCPNQWYDWAKNQENYVRLFTNSAAFRGDGRKDRRLAAANGVEQVMGAAKPGEQQVRAGEVLVERAGKTGFPGFGWFRQGDCNSLNDKDSQIGIERVTLYRRACRQSL
jgi:hypothetical protein